jgi:hypothetical protein
MLNYLAQERTPIKIAIELREQNRRVEYWFAAQSAPAKSMEMHWMMIKEQMLPLLELNPTDVTYHLSGEDVGWTGKLCGNSIEFWFCPESDCVSDMVPVAYSAVLNEWIVAPAEAERGR